MKCVDIKELLETFLDGEMNGATRNAIEQHLDFCKSCRGELESLQSVSSLLKKELPISAPSQLDAKVFAAFRQHHKKESAWNWSAIFGGIFAPKLAFAALTLCVLTSLAFLIGRITAPTQQVIVSNPQIIEKNIPTEVIKYVEVPNTKFVEVPVEKERIVTRTVYRNIEIPRKNESNIARATNVSNPNSDSAQQLDLKDFKPLGEISARVLKKGETNEK